MRIFALTDASPSLTPANFSPKGRKKPKYEDFPLENLPTLFSIISYLLSFSLSSLHSLSVASNKITFRFCLVPGFFIAFLYFAVGHSAKSSMCTYSRCSGDRLFFPKYHSRISSAVMISACTSFSFSSNSAPRSVTMLSSNSTESCGFPRGSIP